MNRRNLNANERSAVDALGLVDARMLRTSFCGTMVCSIYVGSRWYSDISQDTYDSIIRKDLVQETQSGYTLKTQYLKLSR